MSILAYDRPCLYVLALLKSLNFLKTSVLFITVLYLYLFNLYFPKLKIHPDFVTWINYILIFEKNV